MRIRLSMLLPLILFVAALVAAAYVEWWTVGRPPVPWSRTASPRGVVKWISAIEFAEDDRHVVLGAGGYQEDHDFFDSMADI